MGRRDLVTLIRLGRQFLLRAFLKSQDFISHQADFTEINEVLNSFDEPDRIRTVLRF